MGAVFDLIFVMGACKMFLILSFSSVSVHRFYRFIRGAKNRQIEFITNYIKLYVLSDFSFELKICFVGFEIDHTELAPKRHKIISSMPF